MITYHQLRTFLAVARTGNLTKAARELNASQPTVSLQLHALRKSLGAALLERPGGEFRLTPAGEKLRRYAEEVLGGLRILHQDIEALKGSLAGPLAVGATFAMSRYVLAPALSRFRAQFPDVDLQLHVEFPEPLFNGLLADTLDVGCYINVRTPPGLTIERLCEEELSIVASPDHPLAGRRHVTAQELSGQALVAPVPSPLRELIDAKLRRAGLTSPVVAEGSHHDAIKKLVEQNVGYSMLIRASVVDELANGQLVALRLDGPSILCELVVAFRPRPVVSPLVLAFTELVRAELNRTPDVTRLGAGRSARAPRAKGRRRT
jgi:DNA-binding transcriptional LysR family regulator